MAFTRGASERAATAEDDDAACAAVADEEVRENSASLGTVSICAGNDELIDVDGTEITFPEGRRSSRIPAVPEDAITEPEDEEDDEVRTGREEDEVTGTDVDCCKTGSSPISAADASRGEVFCLFDILTKEACASEERAPRPGSGSGT